MNGPTVTITPDALGELLDAHFESARDNEALRTMLDDSRATVAALADERDSEHQDRVFVGFLFIFSFLANLALIAYMVAHSVSAHGLWAGWWPR